jgi:hypothetical protein
MMVAARRQPAVVTCCRRRTGRRITRIAGHIPATTENGSFFIEVSLPALFPASRVLWRSTSLE